jgi:hypothetical protein
MVIEAALIKAGGPELAAKLESFGEQKPCAELSPVASRLFALQFELPAQMYRELSVATQIEKTMALAASFCFVLDFTVNTRLPCGEAIRWLLEQAGMKYVILLPSNVKSIWIDQRTLGKIFEITEKAKYSRGFPVKLGSFWVEIGGTSAEWEKTETEFRIRFSNGEISAASEISPIHYSGRH